MSEHDSIEPEVLEALALGLEPTGAPGPSLRDRLFGAIEGASRFLPFLDRMMDLFDLGEDAARSELAAVDDEERWDDMLPGVRYRDFEGGPGVGEAHGGLVRLEPGHSFPRHGHVGEERLLLLQGTLEDDQGRRYRAGDMVVSEDGSTHEMTVVGDKEVVYAALVIAIEFEESDDDDDDDFDDDDDDDFDA